jgi:SAM-dependent methyltransferase
MSLRGILQRPLIIRLGQFAVTGEWTQKGYRLLAEQIAKGPHDSVLDLGAGRAPLLNYLEPRQYTGLDLLDADLEYARKHFAGPGRDFVTADVLEADLTPWRGVDVVTCSSVFHHLTDEQVVALIDRIAEQVQPKRMVFSDGVVVGRFGNVVAKLDYGDPTRPKEHLYDLFRPRFEVEEGWGYVTPVGAGYLFGFELHPAQAA